MKRFFLRWKKQHIRVLVLLAILLAFLLARSSRPAMNFFTQRITAPLKNAVGAVCGLVPFPVYEVLYIALALWLVVFLVVSVAKVCRGKGQRAATAYGRFLSLLCVALVVLDWFCLAWGANYCADSFQDQSGIRGREVSVEELERLTVYFTEELNAAALTVPRDENGCFAVSRDEIFEHSTEIYGPVSGEFPFLAMDDRMPKRMLFSQVLSAMGFTGVYACFTGESVLNVDSPAAYLPATIAHELAHQRGFASEQECNFIAVVTATKSGIPAYVYSGWLLGYIHLSNALYSADREAWRAVRAQLCDEALSDIRANSAYWEKWESPIEKASSKAYDVLLKSNGQADGVRSYGTVVDLLAAYYL